MSDIMEWSLLRVGHYEFNGVIDDRRSTIKQPTGKHPYDISVYLTTLRVEVTRYFYFIYL